jgi:hypothetical protein
MNPPIIIPAHIQAQIAKTQAEQAADDKIGLQAAGTTLPGPLLDIWAAVPDIIVGPFKVRRFVDGDFIRLSQLKHPLNSFSAIGAWLQDPQPSGEASWLLNWVMTHPMPEVKEKIKAGLEAVKESADTEFSELSGMQLALIMRAIVQQLSIYMGAKLEYEPVPTETAADASPPPSSQQSQTVSAG